MKLKAKWDCNLFKYVTEKQVVFIFLLSAFLLLLVIIFGSLDRISHWHLPTHIINWICECLELLSVELCSILPPVPPHRCTFYHILVCSVTSESPDEPQVRPPRFSLCSFTFLSSLYSSSNAASSLTHSSLLLPPSPSLGLIREILLINRTPHRNTGGSRAEWKCDSA